MAELSMTSKCQNVLNAHQLDSDQMEGGVSRQGDITELLWGGGRTVSHGLMCKILQIIV